MGTFDDEIRAAIQGMSSRVSDPMQAARDMVARRRNVAERGVNSTAYPSPSASEAAAVSAPAQGAGAAELPASAPAPTARPGGDIAQAIADSLGVGGAGAMLEDTPPLPRGIINPGSDAALPIQQDGGTATPSSPDIAANPADDGSSILIPLLASLAGARYVGRPKAGGPIDVGNITEAYRMGDPKIVEAMEVAGITPEMLDSMGSRGLPAPPKGLPKPRRRVQAGSRPSAEAETSEETPESRASERQGRPRSAKQTSGSRPKVKGRAKPKVKVK